MTQPHVTPLADTGHECGVADGQEVALATTFEDLLGEDEATDETADDIIRAVYAWRDVTSPGTGTSGARGRYGCGLVSRQTEYAC
jgi:hypothetical protein